MSNYLSNRQQFVTYNGHKSSHLSISTGVPQGSVLGPLLFLLYINDISNVSRLLNFFLFADDTTILDHGKTMLHLSQRVNTELSKLATYFKINKLSINTEKTKYMIFGPRRQTNSEICLKIDNVPLEKVNVIKFLGVDIDSGLTWKSHISRLQNKISSIVGILCKLRYKLTRTAALLIYDALINSHLNYCNIIWGSNYKYSLNKLFILQKRALRICLKSPKKSESTLLFTTTKKLTIYGMNSLQCAMFMYSSLNKLLPPIFHSYFKLVAGVHSHNVRSKNNLQTPLAKKNTRRFSIKVRGPTIWNNLPIELRSLASLQTFKTHCKNFFNSKSFETAVSYDS
jgi:hypothetical protein